MRILFTKYYYNIYQSIAVSFSLGISLYIIPFVTSYIFHLQWTLFYVFLGTEILIVILILYKKRVKIFNQRAFHFDIYDFLIFSIIIVVAIAMYLRGGHFTGDATFHLSSIMKLAENNTIDPYVPMFKDVKVIDDRYAYTILYGLFAFFYKISGIELKVLWDLSPFIFSIFIWSSLYYLSYRLIQNKEFILLTFIFFILFSSFMKWPAFKYAPYPDVIAHYILLPVGLGNLMVKFDKKNEVYKNAFFTGLILCSITLIHMYSYFAFFILGFCFFLLIVLLDDDLSYKKQLFFFLTVSLIMTLPVLILRLKTSTYTFNISIQNISALLTNPGIKYKGFLRSTISLNSVWKLIIFITGLFFLLFFLNTLYKKIIQKKPLFNDVKFIILFLFSRYFLILLFMVNIINAFFATIITTTATRRFVSYGKYYFYLLFSLFFYLLIKYFRKTKIYSKNNILYKKIGLIIVSLFLIFAYYDLFRNRITKDRYNYRYVMRDNNIYDYIKENVPIWSVFSSYGYPAFEITSQTPNYVIMGVPTHSPIAGGGNRYSHNFHILNIDLPLSAYLKLVKKYDCSYILIETNRDYYDSSSDNIRTYKRGVSLISTRMKAEYFTEIFTKIYEDDKYSLFHINLDIDLDEIEYNLQNSINNITDDFSKGYLLATKLLLLNNKEEYYELQEYFRTKLIENNIDLVKLTVAFHGVSYRSNLTFAGFPNDFNTFFDQEFYPSLKEKIYLTSLNGKNLEDDFQYLTIDFNTIREIHEIQIEWYNYESRAIDFQILTAVDEKNFELIDNISNNTEIIYNKFFKYPLKTEAIKLIIKNMEKDKLTIKSISIY